MARVEEARAICMSVWWEESDLGEPGDDFLSEAGIELFGCFLEMLHCLRTGAAESAAKTAEHLINRIDAELLMLEGIREPLGDARMLSELARQKEMLAFLEQGSPLSSAVRMLYQR